MSGRNCIRASPKKGAPRRATARSVVLPSGKGFATPKKARTKKNKTNALTIGPAQAFTPSIAKARKAAAVEKGALGKCVAAFCNNPRKPPW